MKKTVISVEHLSKRYDLGVIGTGTISRDLSRWWARLRGSPDPYLKIGQADYGNRDGDSIWALDDINFQVEQGEVLGIIGANGAGKSTLLKILSRVTGPTSGVVKVKGRIGSLLEVGTGFHAELTGRENVYLNGAILGMRRAEVDRKFDEIVDFSGVEKFIDTPVKRYSSGMYVRLGFAVAAHLDPEILIVDEVLAVGDAEFQKKCLGKMGDVAGEGRTVLFVSHNMSAIRKICSKCVVLKKGKSSEKIPVDLAIESYINKDNEEFTPTIILPKGEPGMPGEGKTLHISSMDGTPNTVFKLRQPWKVTYEFEIFKHSKQIAAGLYLTMNNDTTSAINFISSPKDLDPGIYQVEFNVGEHLANTRFSFLVFLMSNGGTIYWKRNVGGVTISDDFVGEQPRLFQACNGIILSKQNELINKTYLPEDIR